MLSFMCTGRGGRGGRGGFTPRGGRGFSSRGGGGRGFRGGGGRGVCVVTLCSVCVNIVIITCRVQRSWEMNSVDAINNYHVITYILCVFSLIILNIDNNHKNLIYSFVWQKTIVLD